MTSGASGTAGLFVPKPSTDTTCQRRSTFGLEQIVRGCPLASTAGGGDCHSVRHLVAREPVVSDCRPHTLSKSVRSSSAEVRDVCNQGTLCLWPAGLSISARPVVRMFYQKEILVCMECHNELV